MEHVIDLNSFLKYVDLRLLKTIEAQQELDENIFNEIQFVLSWNAVVKSDEQQHHVHVDERTTFLFDLFDLLTDFESILKKSNINNSNNVLRKIFNILKIIHNDVNDSTRSKMDEILSKRIISYLSSTIIDKTSFDLSTDFKYVSVFNKQINDKIILMDILFEFSLENSVPAIFISQEIVSLLSLALSMDNSKLCANICSDLCLKYFDSDKILIADKEKLSLSIFQLFSRIFDCSEPNNNDQFLFDKEESLCLSTYSILMYLKDSNLYLINHPEVLSILQTIIQNGLASKQNFVRKLARELLKIVILLLKLDNIFSEYITFLEVLEQKQVHLIKPALEQLDLFLEHAELASSSNVTAAADSAFSFDALWILIIFRNGFTHLNGYVAKAMVTKYFQLSPSRCPEIVGHECQVLLKYALPALNDGDFYQRCIDDNVLDSFLNSLKKFISQLVQINHEHERKFFDFVLSVFQSKNWGPVPLMYFCDVLISVQNLTPIWNEENFDQLRCSFYALLQGSSPYFRFAVQECLFNLSIRLIDWTITSPYKFAPNVFPFIPDDLYKYGSKYFALANALWKENKNEIKFLNESFIDCLNDNNRKSIIAVTLIRAKCYQKLMEEITAQINAMLDNVSQRPYLDHNKIIKYLQILADMLSLDSRLLPFVETKLNVENVLTYLSVSLEIETFKIEHMSRWQSIALLVEILFSRETTRYKEHFENFQCKLVDKCSSQLTSNVQKCFYLQLLNACFGNTLSIAQKEKLWHYLLSFTDLMHTEFKGLNKSDGQVFAGEFRKIQWKLIGRLLNFMLDNTCKKWESTELDVIGFTETVFDMFDHVNDETSFEMLICLDLIVKIVPVIDVDLLMKIIDRVKRVIFDMAKSELFTTALKHLVAIMLVGYCKRNRNQNGLTLLNYIKKIFNQLYDEGAQNNAVCYQISKEFYSVFTKFIDNRSSLMKNFGEILVKLCLFGNVIRRDQKTFYAASDYLTKQTTKFESTKFGESEHLAAQKCRIFALLIIEQYFETNGKDIDSLSRLIKTTIEATLESADGKIRTKYYALSYCHRVRTRALQLLLVLQPFVTEERLANDLLIFCQDLLTVEGQLGSIRLMLEFLIVRLFLNFPSFVDYWLNSANEMGAKRIGSLCSWLQVVMQLLLSVANCWSNSLSLCERCISSMLPFCTAQNFTVRCCAQSTLKRIWVEYGSKFTDDRHIPFKILVDSCVKFSLENRNATKNVEKQLSDFYFSVFDVQKHYTLEVIFQLLPLKCQLPMDEWLELDLMRKCVGNVIDNLKFLPLTNNDDLKLAKSIMWNGTAAQTKCEDGEEFVSTKFDALQTKAAVELDASLRSSAGLEKLDTSNEECRLIVVASLIDRPTNLGGLCRTCEVFGASEFVIGSLKFVEDVQFQSLSVSSERWLNITEVKPTDLQLYLLDKQKNGYSLIGAEQTTKSVDLRQFEFPKKTILLLGNEKEGIPPEFIQHLDYCVVIPQVGVIRSMNVHVAGAMLIWEYAKQHRLK